MRLWSLHPEYLDAKGLVALWREGLLAKKVLEGGTRGYRHHPQLRRFRNSGKERTYIKAYLHAVCDAAEERGYNFDRSKLGRRPGPVPPQPVNSEQMDYEWKHLLKKLRSRAPDKFRELKSVRYPRAHPIFKKRKGPVEDWEVIDTGQTARR